MANEFIARKGLLVSGSARISGSVTASLGFSGNGAGITGIISSSYAINAGSSNLATSASFATTASAATSITFVPTTSSFATAAPWSGIQNVPSGLVSSSGQVVYSGITGVPAGIVSSSAQATSWTVLSSSFATTSSFAVSASWAPGGGASISASYALTASYALNGGSGGPTTFAATASYISGTAWTAGGTYSEPSTTFTSSSYALTASYALNGGGGGGGLATRQTVMMESTASVSVGAHMTGTTTMAKGFVVYRVASTVPVRLRLYSSPTFQLNDLTRGTNVEPTGSHGIIVDVVTTYAGLLANLAPFPYGANVEDPATTSIPFTLSNVGTGSAILSASILFLPLE